MIPSFLFSLCLIVSIQANNLFSPFSGKQQFGADDLICYEPMYITKQATALLDTGDSEVEGYIQFDQKDTGSPVVISGIITGLAPGEYSIDIHELGINSKGCKSAGAHFNPDNVEHGSPRAPEHHAGDLGIIKANSKGTATLNLESSDISLNGDRSVIGRTVVVHDNEDGSGTGVACGVIGISSEKSN